LRAGSLRRELRREFSHLLDFLSDNRELQLGGLSFDGNFFFGFLETFDVAADSILGHSARIFQIFSLCDKPGEGRDSHGVPTVFVGFEENGIFVGLRFGSRHVVSIPFPNPDRQAMRGGYYNSSINSSTVISAWIMMDFRVFGARSPRCRGTTT
jgi:hypothetical protein